ncbi:aminoglycoside phosphotransferase family protein [Sorangium sp. So ce1097]|uniref:aminoglycoside phosphotransferase family protein n=1 Tax=Sorangium sp. So ce1097 TaxID=3133330 RepID=UPI003F6370DF
MRTDPQPDSGLARDLVRIGRSLSGDSGPPAEPIVLSSRADCLVVRLGDVVVKAHAQETDPRDLVTRLQIASSPQLRAVLLSPLAVPPPGAPLSWRPAPSSNPPVDRPLLDDALGDAHARLAVEVRGRLVTAWPAGEPVSPDDPDAAPWEEAATLLARLHATALPTATPAGRLPRSGAPARVVRAMARLRAAGRSPAATAVEEAFARLAPRGGGGAAASSDASFAHFLAHGVRWRGERSDVLVHGDFHLGQVVHLADTRVPDAATVASPDARQAPRGGSPTGGFRLIDIDDLGVGDPAWDIARPAAWYAAGLLPPEDFWRFLSAYRASGGCAVPAEGDPWPALDAAARALAVQSAALAVSAASREGRPLDEVETALVDACRRIARVDGLDAPPMP